MLRWLLLCLAMALSSTTVAKSITPLEARAQDILLVLKEAGHEEDVFASSFLRVIPTGQIRDIANSLKRQNGAVTGIEKIDLRGPNAGVISIGYARAVVILNISIEPESPSKVIGLLVAAVNTRDDSSARIAAEFSALSGKAALLVQRLDAEEAPILAIDPDAEQAIGSSFKLWILAEAARAVANRERRWTDVIPLGPPSLPSGMTQAWPKSAPMTLHSLATLMISISDNTASDTLLFAFGREHVSRMLTTIGHAAPSRTLPLLSTIEAFALKMDFNADLRRAVQAGGAAVLDRNILRLGISSIDNSQLAGSPRYIDAVEWFASPADMARTLDWLRLNAGKEALAILAVNPGLGKTAAERFSYLGYKGGSETGVVAMNFLVRTKFGAWYAVAGSWNNPIAAVDEQKFEALMSRALKLIP